MDLDEQKKVLKQHQEILRSLRDDKEAYCPSMCPQREALTREQQNRLHRFERQPGTGSRKDKIPPLADLNAVVKEYSRPAADKAAARKADLRPSNVLLQTATYLASKILSRWDLSAPRCEENIQVYNFVHDRIRAIRQDLSVQKLWDLNCVEILEISCRFYLFALYLFGTAPGNGFDPSLCKQHFHEILLRLIETYRRHRVERGGYDERALLSPSKRAEKQRQAKNTPFLPNEPLFRAVLLIYTRDHGSTMRTVYSLPADMLVLPPLVIAHKARAAIVLNNWIAFFRLLKTAPVVLKLAMHVHVLPMRIQALTVSSYAHGKFGVGLTHVLKSLEFQEKKDLVSLCVTLGLPCDSEKFHRSGEPDKIVNQHELPNLTSKVTIVPPSGSIQDVVLGKFDSKTKDQLSGFEASLHKLHIGPMSLDEYLDAALESGNSVHTHTPDELSATKAEIQVASRRLLQFPLGSSALSEAQACARVVEVFFQLQGLSASDATPAVSVKQEFLSRCQNVFQILFEKPGQDERQQWVFTLLLNELCLQSLRQSQPFFFLQKALFKCISVVATTQKEKRIADLQKLVANSKTFFASLPNAYTELTMFCAYPSLLSAGSASSAQRCGRCWNCRCMRLKELLAQCWRVSNSDASVSFLDDHSE